MQLRSAISALLLVSAATSPACSRNPVEPDDVSATEAVASLVRALEREGLTVKRMEQFPSESHCLSVGALRLAVNSENVYVFEYESAEEANRDASTISSDGSQIAGGGRACMIDWVGPPRFYKENRLIVLYVGTNPDLIRTLDGLLGHPFARR